MEVAGVFKAGAELMSAFAAGALDMGYVGVAPATTAVANKTARVVVLAQVNTEGSAIVVKKDGQVRSIPELVGKVAVVPGHATVQDYLFQRALLKIQDPTRSSEDHGVETSRDDRGVENRPDRRFYCMGALPSQGSHDRSGEISGGLP